MYYVIAAASPTEVSNENQIAARITQQVPLFQEQGRGGGGPTSTIHPFTVRELKMIYKRLNMNFIYSGWQISIQDWLVRSLDAVERDHC